MLAKITVPVGLGSGILARLVALTAGADSMAGMRAPDASLLAAYLAFARDFVLRPNAAHAALFDEKGAPIGIAPVRLPEMKPGLRLIIDTKADLIVYPAGWREKRTKLPALPIFGNAPANVHWKVSDSDVAWARQISAAYDTLARELKDQPIGDVPTGAEARLTLGPLPAMVMLVTGVAAAVIASAAAWRAFDPDYRRRSLEIVSAGEAYNARLNTLVTTGVMPPPSPIETANAAAVEKAASESTSRGWMIAGAAGAGFAIGTTAIGYLTR